MYINTSVNLTNMHCNDVTFNIYYNNIKIKINLIFN